MSSEIDFVLPWVDGTDPHWRKELNKFEISNPVMNSEDRFRDWGNLKYIFRGIKTLPDDAIIFRKIPTNDFNNLKLLDIVNYIVD